MISPECTGTGSHQVGTGGGVVGGSWGHDDILDPYELEVLFGDAVDPEAELDCFADPQIDFVEGLCLRMATGQGGDRGDVIAFVVPFDNDVEITSKWNHLC